jgi:hypothetical protein
MTTPHLKYGTSRNEISILPLSALKSRPKAAYAGERVVGYDEGMDAQERDGDFFFNGMDVGILSLPIPRVAGNWHYVPYRGPGHYDLQMALRDRQPAQCVTDDRGTRITFTVVGCPADGVLEVRDVQFPNSD